MYLADLEEALEAFGPKFMQLYGQGESPMTITSLQRSEIADRDQTGWKEKAASVGRAMSCVELRVVDQTMNDLTSGEPGEVIVRGLTVMKGYWRNQEATKQTLVDGWLKTGDIGRLTARFALHNWIGMGKIANPAPQTETTITSGNYRSNPCPRPAKKDWNKTGASVTKAKVEKPKDWSKKADRAGAIKKAPTPRRDLDRSR